MDQHPGVFASNADTDEWEPDTEVPGSDVHVLVDADGVQAGLTRFVQADAPVPWTSSAREVFIVLEGSVRIEIEGGADLELRVGDMASLPKGLPTVWHVSVPFKEMWVIA
jgi:uncharacterized cupin superfamily protein